tara:strand:+ start:1217 stop:1810 length:594 start_codon:yes stop_codon:yes gene_type:complete
MSRFDAPVEERTLHNYIDEARAMIGRWGQMWMLTNDDVIANVANAIMRAEHDFDPTRGCKRVTLRCTYGRRAIIKEFRTLNRLSKRPTHFSIDVERIGNDGRVYSNAAKEIEDHRESIEEYINKKEEATKQKRIAQKVLKNKCLTEKQRKYLKMHYLKGKSVREIAQIRGCSKQAVSQVLQGGLSRLQKTFVGKAVA